jgi:hypothetical protein
MKATPALRLLWIGRGEEASRPEQAEALPQPFSYLFHTADHDFS